MQSDDQVRNSHHFETEISVTHPCGWARLVDQPTSMSKAQVGTSEGERSDWQANDQDAAENRRCMVEVTVMDPKLDHFQ